MKEKNQVFQEWEIIFPERKSVLILEVDQHWAPYRRVIPHTVTLYSVLQSPCKGNF